MSASYLETGNKLIRGEPATETRLFSRGFWQCEVGALRDQGATAARGRHTAGTVVVSATNLSGQFLDDPHAYQWVLSHPETEIPGHSLFRFQSA